MQYQRPIYTSKGKTVQFGKELGRGGEGAVFEVHSDANTVAKIYHKALATEKQDKLRAMVALPANVLSTFAVWPIDTLHISVNGPVCGFTMPRLGQYRDLFELYIPINRKQAFPQADWRFLIQSARNLAASVAAMHQAGHVVGDMNPKNFVASANATVKLIDCDSFQLAANGKIFPCEVGVPHFTAPELQGKSFKGVLQTPNHDNFALALLCFHLLFMGRHPYAGRFSGQGDMPIERAIREFRYAYSQTSSSDIKMAPPPNSLSVLALPSSMQRMFEVAFGQEGVSGKRPLASEWVRALDELARNLVVCPVFPAHQYYQSHILCPWCAIENTSGVQFFLDLPKPSTPMFDFEKVWKQIQDIDAPIPLVMPKFRYVPTPSPMPDYVVNAKPPKWPWSQHPVDSFVKQLHAEFDQANHAWMQATDQWTLANDISKFHAKRKDLEQIQQAYRALRRQFDHEKQRLEQNAGKLQLQAFLERYHIDQANIMGIGAARRASLISFGIETAADISEQAIAQIPGFGPMLTQELLTWRRDRERHFRFDPQQGISAADIAKLKHKYAPKKVALQQQLTSGANELRRIKQQIIDFQQATTRQIEDAAQLLAQSQANHDAAITFQGFVNRRRKHKAGALGAVTLFFVLGIALTMWTGAVPSLIAYTQQAFSISSLVTSATATLPPTPQRLEGGVQASPLEAPTTGTPTQYSYRVVNVFPHDPDASTQGLVFLKGDFFESTGLYGKSSLRRVGLNSGRVLELHNLDESLFGQGLTIFDDKIYQLTWQNRIGFVYDRSTFEELQQFTYTTEGWGLTHDGQNLIMSDGTSTLLYINPETLEQVRRLRVTVEGEPLIHLNELEYVDGRILANVWQTDMVVRIDPVTGRVDGIYDFTGLLTHAESFDGKLGELNGIALDPVANRLFVTGKLWPYIFEVELVR